MVVSPPLNPHPQNTWSSFSGQELPASTENIAEVRDESLATTDRHQAVKTRRNGSTQPERDGCGGAHSGAPQPQPPSPDAPASSCAGRSQPQRPEPSPKDPLWRHLIQRPGNPPGTPSPNPSSSEVGVKFLDVSAHSLFAVLCRSPFYAPSRSPRGPRAGPRDLFDDLVQNLYYQVVTSLREPPRPVSA